MSPADAPQISPDALMTSLKASIVTDKLLIRSAMEWPCQVDVEQNFQGRHDKADSQYLEWKVPYFRSSI